MFYPKERYDFLLLLLLFTLTTTFTFLYNFHSQHGADFTLQLYGKILKGTTPGSVYKWRKSCHYASKTLSRMKRGKNDSKQSFEISYRGHPLQSIAWQRWLNDFLTTFFFGDHIFRVLIASQRWQMTPNKKIVGLIIRSTDLAHTRERSLVELTKRYIHKHRNTLTHKDTNTQTKATNFWAQLKVKVSL